MKELIRLMLTINPKGVDWYEGKWNCKERQTTIELSIEGRRSHKIIKKSDVGIISQSASIYEINLSTFTEPHRLDETKKIMMARAIAILADMQKSLDKLKPSVDSLEEFMGSLPAKGVMVIPTGLGKAIKR